MSTTVSSPASAAIAAPSKDTSFDLEAAVMMINMGRVNNMDAQLKLVLKKLEDNNTRTAALNEAYRVANTMANEFGSDTDPDKTMKMKPEDIKAMDSALAVLGMTGADVFGPSFSVNDAFNANATAENKYTTEHTTMISDSSNYITLRPSGYSNVTMNEFKSAAAKLKGDLDASNNTQQMDMVTLQTLTSKRNESFETMSAMLKKILDALSAIINRM